MLPRSDRGLTPQRTPSTSSIRSAKPYARPSRGNVDAEWTHDLHALNNPPSSRSMTRNDRLLHSLARSDSDKIMQQANIVNQKRQQTFSIRGMAGPYPVIAKNFAYGTTAADIESAMMGIGGVCLDCRLLSESPYVMAEMVFDTKEGADAIVKTFNLQNVRARPRG